MKSVIGSNQTADRKAGTIHPMNTPEIPREQAAKSAAESFSEEERRVLKRAFETILSERLQIIDIEFEGLLNDSEIERKRGTFTKETKSRFIARNGELRQEEIILKVLKKGVSPGMLLDVETIMIQGIKEKWLPYIGILYEVHKLFAEQSEAATVDMEG